MSRSSISEGKLLFLIGAVQFVNVLDFMMVMPLGPDFSRALGIDASRLGVVGGSYAAAAAVSGVLGAQFLDRFDRRKALAWALTGLVIGTLLGGLAWNLTSLIVARVVAGAFGGPATAVSLAIIADVVPIERRGRAMGAVMGAFSLASTFGVPAGLKLAEWGSWQTPFFAVAGLGAVVATLAISIMPPVIAHLSQVRVQGSTLELLRKPTALLSLSCTSLAMAGNFALIPNLSTYFQFNLAYPRSRLDLLYMIGGAVSFLTLRIAGKLADGVGPARAASIGTALFLVTLVVGFIWPIVHVPTMALFVCYMVTGSFRFVPMQALSSRVPEPSERARFMSAQSCVQHAASALGAIIGAQLLVARPDGTLEGIPAVATFTAITALLLPLVMLLVEQRVRQRERERATRVQPQGVPA